MNESFQWLEIFKTMSTILAILTVPSVLIERRGRPVAAVSWLLALATSPFIGFVLWWTIGHNYLEKRKHRRRLSSREAGHKIEQLQGAIEAPPPAESSLIPIKRLPADDYFGLFAPSSGNQVRVLSNGAEIFEAIEKAIAEARHHIHLEFYIWKNDGIGARLRDLLAKRAKEGIKVRLLCDGIGSYWATRGFMQPLTQAGGQFTVFLPPRLSLKNITLNFRNHRKIIVVDGKKAIVGSANIGNEYARQWYDIAVDLQGPVVDQAQEVFADDWYFANGEDLFTKDYFGRHEIFEGKDAASCGVIASGPDTWTNVTRDAFFAAINSSTKRIWITTPYFAPDEAILVALRSAYYRGVDVRLLLPKHSDLKLTRFAARSFYPELMKAGVRIFEYEPCVLHAKSLIFDDELSIIGSANMDSRSFRLNFEASCFIGSKGVNARLAEIFESDIQRSAEITESDLRSRSYIAKALEAGAHLLSPLL